MATRIIFILCILMLITSKMGFAQSPAATITVEKLDTLNLIGKYTNQHGRTIELKKNHKYKQVTGGPRRRVSKGTWHLRGDTVICKIYHTNTVHMGDNKRLISHPETLKIITVNGKLRFLKLSQTIEDVVYPIIYVELEKVID